MKKIIFISLTIIVIILSVASMTSCGHNNLSGKYIDINDPNNICELKSNGEFRQSDGIAGTYWVDGDTIFLQVSIFSQSYTLSKDRTSYSDGYETYVKIGKQLPVTEDDKIAKNNAYITEIDQTEDFKYAVYSDKTVEILQYIGAWDAITVTIPQTIDGNKVTSIAYYEQADWSHGVFAKCNLSLTNYLTEIIIPDGIVYIGDYAFKSCRALKYVTIPDSVTYIGDSAFEGCWDLTSIKIPDKVTHIGAQAFSDCTGLTSVILPKKITRIEHSTFSNDWQLTEITIPDSVTYIGDHAFSGNGYYGSALTNVTISKKITYVGNGAFAYCRNLTITCYKDSAAHKYCQDENVMFKLK